MNTTIILKNISTGDLTYSGQVFRVNKPVVPINLGLLLATPALFAAIDAGDIIVNDGTNDLSAEKGKAQLYAPLFGDVQQPFYVTVDRQMAIASAKVITTSRTLVDLDSMTLITKDMDDTGVYVITFVCDYKHQKDDKECYFSLNVDGLEVAVTKVVGYKNDKRGTVSLTHRESGIAGGTIIKVQVSQESTDQKKDELTIEDRRLVIDGVKSSSVL